MESKSDTSAQSPILDREVSIVESLVILFDQRYLVWKVAAKASWKQLEQYCTEDTLRNILSTNEDGRLEVIQAFDALRQTSVPQQETRRRVDTCVAAANAMRQRMTKTRKVVHQRQSNLPTSRWRVLETMGNQGHLAESMGRLDTVW